MLELEQKNGEIRQELDTRNSEVRALEDALKETKNSLENKAQELKNELESEQNKVGRLSGELEQSGLKLSAKITEMSDLEEKYEKEKSELQSSLQELEVNKGDLQRKYDELENQLQESHQHFAVNKQLHTKDKEELNKKIAEVSELHETKNSMEQQSNVLREQLRSQTVQIQTLDSQLKKSQQRVLDNAGIISGLQTKNRKDQDELAKKTQKINSLERQLSTLTVELNELARQAAVVKGTSGKGSSGKGTGERPQRHDSVSGNQLERGYQRVYHEYGGGSWR